MANNGDMVIFDYLATIENKKFELKMKMIAIENKKI